MLKEFILKNNKNLSFLRGQFFNKKNEEYLNKLKEETSFLGEEFNFSERVYCFLNNITSHIMCKNCNNRKVNFKNSSLGYLQFCSSSCSFNYTKKDRETTNLEKYGVKNILMTEENKKKLLDTNKNNKQEISLKLVEAAKRKNKEDIKEKIQANWKNKSEEERYEIKQNQLNKKKEKYGTFTPNLEKTAITRKKNTFLKKIDILAKDNIVCLFSENEYKGVKWLRYKFKCLTCETTFESSFDNGRNPKCPKCNKNNGTSKPELELFEFLETLNIKGGFKRNCKTLIKPLEVDAYFEELKIAIEFNGNYYHSAEYLDEHKQTGKIKQILKQKGLEENIGKNYHLLKTLLLNDLGIELLHINEYEWTNPLKKEIWKNIIKEKLQKKTKKNNDGNEDVVLDNTNYFVSLEQKNKIIVKDISQEIEYYKNVFEKYNLDGFPLELKNNKKINNLILIGLFNEKNEVIYIMLFKKIDINSINSIELVSFFETCLNNNCLVMVNEKLSNESLFSIGFSFFKENYNTFNNVVVECYLDRRYNNKNNVLENANLGFKYIGYIEPKIKYLKNEMILENYEKNIEEKNIKKIYNVGYLKYLYNM
jgi:hypothetical protein